MHLNETQQKHEENDGVIYYLVLYRHIIQTNKNRKKKNYCIGNSDSEKCVALQLPQLT